MKTIEFTTEEIAILKIVLRHVADYGLAGRVLNVQTKLEIQEILNKVDNVNAGD